MTSLSAHLRARLARLPREPGLAVALSGGGDSTALLHALAGLRGPLVPALRALHVHHGLLPEADDWAERCAALCRELDVPLEVLRVAARPRGREGPEAAARRARYAALAAALVPGETCLTAHHRDDQAETFLLQALRGAGPAGLAAMPPLRRLGRGWLARPLLELPRAALRAHLEAHGLGWAEDPANRDRRLLRARLRHEAMPALEAARPGAAATLARAAAHCAEAAALLEALAGIDLAAVGAGSRTLPVAGLARLEPARARNALRHWIRRAGLPVPGSAQLEAALRMTVASRGDAAPVFRWPGGELRRHAGALHLLPPLPEPRLAPRRWDLAAPLALPELGGELRAEPARGPGLLDPARVAGGVEVRLRRGGERLRPWGRAGTRPLKKLLQEAGLPPWERERLPLLVADGAVAAVPGVAVAAAFATGSEDSRGLRIVWRAPWHGPAPGAGERPSP